LPRGLKAWVCGRSLAEIAGSSPAGEHGFLSVVSRTLPGRGFCDKLITRPEKSYLLWFVVVCDLETWPALGHSATGMNSMFKQFSRSS